MALIQCYNLTNILENSSLPLSGSNWEVLGSNLDSSLFAYMWVVSLCLLTCANFYHLACGWIVSLSSLKSQPLRWVTKIFLTSTLIKIVSEDSITQLHNTLVEPNNQHRALINLLLQFLSACAYSLSTCVGFLPICVRAGSLLGPAPLAGLPKK